MVAESANLFVLLTRDKLSLVMLPKRVFPSESWQTWFRTLANNRPHPAELADPPQLHPAAGSLALQFQLGLRDYADRALASWRTWAMVLGIVSLVLGTAIYSNLNPAPGAMDSGWHLFFTFELPLSVGLATMLVLLCIFYPWFCQRKLLSRVEVALSEQGLDQAGADGVHHQPWTSYDCFKETPWSFILWRRPGGQCLLLPKRALPAPDGLDRCRALLRTHLRPSRWYFG